MDRHYFVTRMPDEPGTLHQAAKIVWRHGGNIERIHFDRRIDRHTVFFEVECDERMYLIIEEGLKEIGYIRTEVPEPAFVRFRVKLPNVPGALLSLLEDVTLSDSNIAFLEFDARDVERMLTVSLTLEDSSRAKELLEALQSHHPVEILEHATTGDRLDDTVFYLRFAQELRGLLPPGDDGFVLRLLGKINHIVQDLQGRGEEPEVTFESILCMGRALLSSRGPGFHCDVQTVNMGDAKLHCLQMPCGGNVSIIEGRSGTLMVDSGFGIYHEGLRQAMNHLGIDQIDHILQTHGDDDHSGGARFLDSNIHASRETVELMAQANRAHGSPLEDSVLEEVYTTLIHLFSDYAPPMNVETWPEADDGLCHGLGVMDRTLLCDEQVWVLRGLDGHQIG